MVVLVVLAVLVVEMLLGQQGELTAAVAALAQ
jgi:Mn-containing catalase